MTRWRFDGDFKQISQGRVTMIIVFLVILEGRALVQLETNLIGPTFSLFNSCPSLTSVPIAWEESLTASNIWSCNQFAASINSKM